MEKQPKKKIHKPPWNHSFEILIPTFKLFWIILKTFRQVELN